MKITKVLLIAAAALSITACASNSTKTSSNGTGTCHALSSGSIMCDNVAVYDSRFDVVPSDLKYGNIDAKAATSDGKVIQVTMRTVYTHAPHSTSGSTLLAKVTDNIETAIASKTFNELESDTLGMIKLAVLQTENYYSPDRYHFVEFHKLKNIKVTHLTHPND